MEINNLYILKKNNSIIIATFKIKLFLLLLYQSILRKKKKNTKTSNKTTNKTDYEKKMKMRINHTNRVSLMKEENY